MWLEHDEHVWLIQRPDTGVWAGLWTLPLLETELAALALTQALGEGDPEPQPPIDHVLTHLDWRLHPQRLVLARPVRPAVMSTLAGTAVGGDAAGTGRWVALEQLHSVGLPAPLKKLLPVHRP